MNTKAALSIVIKALLVVLLASCNESPPESGGAPTEHIQALPALPVVKQSVASLETRRIDWSEIKQLGYIRAVKMLHEEEASLPRSGSSSLYHLGLFEQFAERHQLEIRWTSAESLKQMMQLLEEGKIDVIPRHFTITQPRSSLFSFTTPLLTGKEYLVAPKDKQVDPNSLENIELILPEASAYVDTVSETRPDWHIKYLSTNTNAEAIADQLTESSDYFSILDEVSVDALLEYREDIKKVKILNNRHYAWATQKQAKLLVVKLNEFIKANHVLQSSSEQRGG